MTTKKRPDTLVCNRCAAEGRGPGLPLNAFSDHAKIRVDFTGTGLGGGCGGYERLYDLCAECWHAFQKFLLPPAPRVSAAAQDGDELPPAEMACHAEEDAS